MSVSKQVDTGVKTAGPTKGQIDINQTAIQIVEWQIVKIVKWKKDSRMAFR
jgi:hypothetical protein